VADFARAMQWLFLAVGLLFIGGATLDGIFGAEDGGSQDITLLCTTGTSTMTCTGQVDAPDDSTRILVTAVVGVGLLLVATVMAITAGSTARRATPMPGPHHYGPPTAYPPPGPTPHPGPPTAYPPPHPGGPY
jgi:hypothetical protein